MRPSSSGRVLVRTIVSGISGSCSISETESPFRGMDTVLEKNSTPYRNDGREEDEEPKDVNIPHPSEAVMGNEDERKSKCHSTEDLYNIR